MSTATSTVPRLKVRYNDETKWESQRERLASAWEIADTQPEPITLILERIDSDQI